MTNDLEAQVIAAEERLRQAQLHSDVSALDELIAPELLFTGHIGQLVSKDDDLAAHRARVLHLEESEALEQHIRIYPGFAVVSVLLHLVGSYEGTPIDQQMRYTRVWSIAPRWNHARYRGAHERVPTGVSSDHLCSIVAKAPATKTAAISDRAV